MFELKIFSKSRPLEDGYYWNLDYGYTRGRGNIGRLEKNDIGKR